VCLGDRDAQLGEDEDVGAEQLLGGVSSFSVRARCLTSLASVLPSRGGTLIAGQEVET
jgi:hypothetical protein